MISEGFTRPYQRLGRVTAWAVFGLIVIYAVTTGLGFLSLKSPADPIGDPYFTIMEVLIFLLVPPLVMSMVAVHAYAPPRAKPYTLIALLFMVMMGTLTSGIHFAIMTVSRAIEAAGFTEAPLLFSFSWPSVAYTLDILAWDWFFALSMLFGAPAFAGRGLERTLRYLFVASGVLSLIGLLGVPLAIAHAPYWSTVRNIGILGYSVVALPAFLLLAMVFGRAAPAGGEAIPPSSG